jgi:small subunit ribosomal protein S20
MPHLKSAKKRLRQNIKRRDHNRATKKALKKQLKAVFEGGADLKTTVDQVKKDATAAVKKLDKAAARGVIHRNNAARKKSQIARLINAKSKPAAQAAAK